MPFAVCALRLGAHLLSGFQTRASDDSSHQGRLLFGQEGKTKASVLSWLWRSPCFQGQLQGTPPHLSGRF